MTWDYVSTSDDDPKSAIQWLQRQIPSHSATEGQISIAKPAIADQQDGPARGVLYFWKESATPSLPQRPSDRWDAETFTTRNDYEGMYQNALELLQGEKKDSEGRRLSPQQQAAAKVTLSNRKDGNALLTVYYPR